MRLTYPNKKSEEEIFIQTPPAHIESVTGVKARNKLIRGDNVNILKYLLEAYRNTIDLIYIDPPFATNTEFKIGNHRTNTVSSSLDDSLAYSDTLLNADFLEFLRERLVFLRELLSDRGSIYLHIDYKIGHYVKIIMDEIFGRKNFRNDITRIKCNPKNFSRKAYGNVKDLILFYSKSDNPIWNEPKVSFSIEEENRLFKKIDSTGRRYTTIPLHAPGETSHGDTGKEWRGMKPPKGRHWRSAPVFLEELDAKGLVEWSANSVPRRKIFLDEKNGKKMQDIWEFKDPQYPSYPTEKSLDLLTFIINASSDEHSIILDCFCGSGTTLLAAQMLNRAWIGIDQSEAAICVVKKRLSNLPANLFSPSVYEYLEEMSTPSRHVSGVEYRHFATPL